MIRRLAGDGSLLGIDPPQGSAYYRTPNVEVSHSDEAPKKRKKRKKKKKKHKTRRRKHFTEIDALGNKGKNYDHNRIFHERPGDSGQKITGVMPQGYGEINIGKTSEGGPGHGFYHGNVSPFRASQWNVYVAKQNRRLRVLANTEPKKIFIALDNKWSNAIDNSQDLIVFNYVKLAYLFQEIMYDITELIKKENFDEESLVCFTYDWLFNNPLTRQVVKRCPMSFTDNKNYYSLIQGLYNLRYDLSGVQEYDHSFNTNLRSQRSFY